MTILAAVVVLAAVVGPASATGSTGGASDARIECEFPFSATDATGTEVTVETEPQEIVTLNPSAAQTMWEIGAEQKVVGVSKYATYLEGAKAKQNISGGGRSFVSAEKVISLEPDLVLAPNTISNDTVGQLRNAGLTVYRLPFQASLEDIREKTLLTGQLTGECDGAEETVAWMDEELNTVRDAIEGQQRPRALYVFFGYTGGEGTFVDTVIEAAGGNNVAADANISGYKPISQEIVVDADPEWIVLNDAAPRVPKTDAYNGTYAVRNDQIVVLQEEYISQPAPRIVRSVVTLAKAFHPEAYERAAATTTVSTPGTTTAADDTPVPDGTATPTATPTDSEFDATGPSAETTTGASGPGFGISVAALALAVLFARRRGE